MNAPLNAARHALVIGYGSIGKRHARVLRGMGLEVAVVSRRNDGDSEFQTFPDIAEALAKRRPDYVVIATETSAHFATLQALKNEGLYAQVLVEKPLFAQTGMSGIDHTGNIHVGYQLRFHPAVTRLRQLLAGAPVIAAQFYVGQHIDGWRQGRGARESYSGHAKAGGGVLRDLSHELDLALWLFGDCERVAALGGRFADVTDDSDDAWGILARFERCPIASFHLNYLDRISRRQIDVITAQQTISVDLIASRINVNGEITIIPCDPDTAFVAMHGDALGGNAGLACDYEAGMRVVEMIDAAERASGSGTWIVP